MFASNDFTSAQHGSASNCKTVPPRKTLPPGLIYQQPTSFIVNLGGEGERGGGGGGGGGG